MDKRNGASRIEVSCCIEVEVRARIASRGAPYLHEVLDLWFHREVLPRLRGRAFLVRYADDFVIAFEREIDARRVHDNWPRTLVARADLVWFEHSYGPMPRSWQRFVADERLLIGISLLALLCLIATMQAPSQRPVAGAVPGLWAREHEQVTDADVALLVLRVRDRVRRKLRQLSLEMDSAAVEGVAAIGERADQRDRHLDGTVPERERDGDVDLHCDRQGSDGVLAQDVLAVSADTASTAEHEYLITFTPHGTVPLGGCTFSITSISPSGWVSTCWRSGTVSQSSCRVTLGSVHADELSRRDEFAQLRRYLIGNLVRVHPHHRQVWDEMPNKTDGSKMLLPWLLAEM